MTPRGWEDGAPIWRPLALAPVEQVIAWCQDPTATTRPPHLLLMGVAGTGKSLALKMLAEHAVCAELSSAGPHTPRATSRAEPRLRVVDDAHLLTEAQAADLRAASSSSAIVLAARPWPESKHLQGVLDELRAHRVVYLRPWDITEIAGFLEAHDPSTAPDQAAELYRMSAGFPWLASRIATSVADVATETRSRIRELSPVARHVVEELAIGFEVDDCPTGASVDPHAFDEVLAEIDAAGLMTNDGDLPAAVTEVATADLPVHRRRRLQRAAVETLPHHASTDPDRYRRLVQSGLRDERLARGLVECGDATMVSDPSAAAQWYDLAAQAGALETDLLGRRAELALRLGHLSRAAALVDQALVLESPKDPRRIAQVAFAVHGRLGMGPRLMELERWLGQDPSGIEAAAAITVLLGQGNLASAEQVLATYQQHDVGRTSKESAAALVINGLAESLAPAPTQALPHIMQGAQLLPPATYGPLSPMHPAAMAAIMALHCGELTVAEGVLRRALSDIDDRNCWYRRLSHLASWTQTMLGNLSTAEELRAAALTGPFSLTTRDSFWDLALGVAIARRGDQLHLLAQEWAYAAERIMSHSVDLYDLLALGELHIAGMRVRDDSSVAAELAAAWSLLDDLGAPPLWSTNLHWAAIQGGILTNDAESMIPHVEMLERFGQTFLPAVVLAHGGAAWVHVIRREFSTDRVVQTAHDLHEAGHAWEASRLAGHAAARAVDRRDTARLLECARGFDVGPVSAEQSAPQPRNTVIVGKNTAHLSDRERQVVQLVLAGHTYREIGAQLFLSDRTVEHHMARIRRRLGASSRGELLKMLAEGMGQLNNHRPAMAPEDAATS